MHDTNLLQLITDDLAPAQHLLELLHAESIALHGRDLFLLEEILAQKQSLVIMLEQRGRKRSQILVSLNLKPDREGLAELARNSSVGEALLTQGDALSASCPNAAPPTNTMVCRSNCNRRPLLTR